MLIEAAIRTATAWAGQSSADRALCSSRASTAVQSRRRRWTNKLNSRLRANSFELELRAKIPW